MARVADKGGPRTALSPSDLPPGIEIPPALLADMARQPSISLPISAEEGKELGLRRVSLVGDLGSGGNLVVPVLLPVWK